MLQSLHIHNFALIEDLQLSFGEGITIFTGETGAGKSILLDAIGMLAGKRASASFVRQGTDAFRVEGAFFFSVIGEHLARLLEENHIECDDGQLVICRQFYRSGRGTTLVNGTLVPTAVVKRIGEYLLDIHGQFDNRLIFDPAYHVGILDSLTPELQQERRRYDEMYGAWRSLCQQARKLQHDEGEKARMTSILDFQIKEIESAQLQIGEDDELEKKVLSALTKNEHGVYLALSPEVVQQIIAQLGDLRKKFAELSQTPIVLTSQIIRVYLSRMISQFYPDVYVLSFNEVTGSVQIQAIGNITLQPDAKAGR